MRARRNIIVGLVLWAIVMVFFLISHLHNKPKQVNLYKATPGGSNIQFPYLANSHTIDFFTGSAFAGYDTRTQTSQTISPQFSLPTVNDVRWSKTGVMFRASDYNAADDLFPALNKKGLPTDKEYWWLYSFADKKLNVVVPKNAYFNAADVFWNSSGGNYCYVSTDGSLYLSNNPGHRVAKVNAAARIKQFTGSTITLADGTLLRQINTDTGQSKTLVDAVFQDSYVSPDGRTIAYVLNTHPKSNDAVPGDLYKVSAEDLKPHKVLSGFGGTMAGNGGDLFVGYTDTIGNNHLRLYPKTGRATDYSLGSSLNRGNYIGTILPVSSRTIYIISKTNNLVQVTSQKKSVSTPVSYEYKIQTDLYENGYEIHYDPYKGTYELDIAANPYQAYQNAALDYIRAQKVDPNQINITWRAYDGVDKTNPAVDTTPLPVGHLLD